MDGACLFATAQAMFAVRAIHKKYLMNTSPSFALTDAFDCWNSGHSMDGGPTSLKSLLKGYSPGPGGISPAAKSIMLNELY